MSGYAVTSMKVDGSSVTQSVSIASSTTIPVSQSGAFSVGITNASIPVTGIFWQATQPVSISGTVPVSGTVGISGSVAVTGTFFQATQPVSLAALPALATGGNVIGAVTQSGTWNVNISNASLAVTGTFWQATQPVSIASMPSTPVTGTFWQATQPVSGTVTVGNASLAVTGTFWQATQPISGNVGVTGSVAVTGTFWQATQPISAAALPLPTGAATDATLVLINAKQPALGTAGNQSSDVLTVQGSPWGQRVPVAVDATTKAQISLAEQMDQLVAAQVATVHLLSQLLAVCRGLAAPLPGEEADQLIGEFMDGRTATVNVMN